MPAGAAFSLIQFIVEGIFYLISSVSHPTARVILPMVTLGHVRVAPRSKYIIDNWRGTGRTIDGTIIISAGLGSVLGFLFWIALGVVAYRLM